MSPHLQIEQSAALRAYLLNFVYHLTSEMFDGDRTVAYRVDVDWAPMYEALMSLQAFANKPDRKILEAGEAWVKATREQLTPELVADLADLAAADQYDTLSWLDLLVRQCPGERDVDGFLRWLPALSPGELYERMAPFAGDGYAVLPRDAGAMRDEAAHLIARWHEGYFRHIDAAILEGLRAAAIAARARADVMAPLEAVEHATNGVRYLPEPPPDLVVLIPQYHYRPWSVFNHYQGLHIIGYPVDALPPAPGAPPPPLPRLTRALSDESRLRILRFLASEPRGFTEIVRFSGLAKSTVHHHMVILRAAGLVRVLVRQCGDSAETYALRPHAIDTVGEQLRAFLHPM